MTRVSFAWKPDNAAPRASSAMTRFLQSLTFVLFATFGTWPEEAWSAPIPHSLAHEYSSPGSVRQTETRLGYSLAIDGGWMVVGSPFDDLGGEDSGVVWVHNSVTGSLLRRVGNPLPLPMSRFGWSVALSGNRMVIGAPDDNTGASDAGIAYVYDLASVTPEVPVLTLLNPNPATNDGFGFSVAMTGTTVVVGTPDGDSGIADAGCVYVYDITSATPAVPVLQMNNPNPAGQNFGQAVSISGSMIAVGACQDAQGADSSRAYVYDLTSATPAEPVLTLDDGTPATNEQFGFAVTISGGRVVVSAPRDDTSASDSGRAYAFDLSSPTPAVPMATLTDSSPAADDLFGMSVSISGHIVAVGAPFDDDGASNSGSTYLFDLSSPTPEVALASVDNPGPASNDEFGWAVALSGARLVVAADRDDTGADNAGSAYVFELSSGTPEVPVVTINNPSPSSNEEFGGAVAISGSHVAIGSPRDDKGAGNAGSVVVYDLTSVNPVQPALLFDNPGPTLNDYFGASVAASGSRVAVGAYQDDTGASNTGTVYVYDISSPTPATPVFVINNPSPQSQDEFGYSLAMSGDLLAVGSVKNNTGAEDAGSVYVYNLAAPTPGALVQVLDNPEPGIGDWFGHAVSISGNRVVVGAPRDDAGAVNAGSAYVFDLASATPAVPVTVIGNPAPAVNDEFGFSVAVSGLNVVIGSRTDDTFGVDAGDVLLYHLNSANPATPVAGLTRPAPDDEDFFGTSVAISGTRIVVGAPGADLSADEAGAAYVYELSSATSTVPADLLQTGTQRPADWFGQAVAIDGTNAVIGAPKQDGNTNNRGAAYLFDPDPPAPAMQVEQPPGNGLLGGAASIHFGNAPVGSSDSTQIVLVRNIGTSLLEVQAISITGGNAEDFSFVAPPLPVSLAVDASMLLEVAFQPGTTGSRVSTLRIESNSGNGNPFEITLTGQALSAGDDTDGDGLNDVAELQMEAMGFDWQVNDEELVLTLNWGANAEGLYTGEQLQSMSPSTPLLPRDPVTGGFKLTVAATHSSDLSGFGPFPMAAPQTLINTQGALEFRFTPTEPKAFFRLEPR
jgi:hypothetical protein